jgi:hypothetical protein
MIVVGYMIGALCAFLLWLLIAYLDDMALDAVCICAVAVMAAVWPISGPVGLILASCSVATRVRAKRRPPVPTELAPPPIRFSPAQAKPRKDWSIN